MTLHSDRSYKATRPAGEQKWRGVAVSHVGTGRRVALDAGDDPMAAIEAANDRLDAELRGEVAGVQPPNPSEIAAGFGSPDSVG